MNIVDQLVNIATTPDTVDVLAELLGDADCDARIARKRAARLDKLAALAEADRLYAELMRAHDALVANPAPLDLPAAA